MPRSRRAARSVPSRRRGILDRHGRGLRSAVTGPYLPPLRDRIEQFDVTIAATAEYLRDIWPELDDVRFEVAGAPEEALHGDHVDRWKVLIDERRIIFFRLPIQRMSKLHRNDELHRRMMVEGCVFRAVAELVGKDPWDLDPDRFRDL